MADKSTLALIGHIIADSVTRMVPSEPMTVTKHPIEDGSIIAEHIAEGENTLTMDCTFTDELQSVITDGSVTVITKTTADDKRKAAYKLKRDRKIVNIDTIKDRYESMALVDIQEDITPRNARAFVATLVFDKVRTATAMQTSIPLDRVKKKSGEKKTAALKQVPTEDQGQQSPEAVDTEAEAAVNEALDGVFGDFGS